MNARRVLYLQYADPAAYPPIEHSSKILADRGWDVVLLGTHAFGNHNFSLPPHPRIRAKNLRSRGNQGIEYFFYFIWSLYWVWRWRPKWIYASDPLVLPTIWMLRKLSRARLLYHEHDSPNPDRASSRFMRLVLGCRRVVGSDAELCIIPQQGRLKEFVKKTGRKGATLCVWNCPTVDEIRIIADEVRVKAPEPRNQFVLYYHGSINGVRLPRELVVAASRFKGTIRLRVAGYETAGSAGYVEELVSLAKSNGAPELIEFLGLLPLRTDILRIASEAHLGLSLMPKVSQDVNLRHMVGASNKPFDFMACGLPLLVTDLPDWSSVFVAPGYGRACDPTDADSIEAQLRWYVDHPDERREMGRRCAQKVKEAWNYETQLAGAIEILEGGGNSTGQGFSDPRLSRCN